MTQSTIRYHATPISNWVSIQRDGLTAALPGKGGCDFLGIYVTDGWDPSDFIQKLYQEPVVLLAVDVTGLRLIEGEDGTPEREEWCVLDDISPDRITLITPASLTRSH